jgi:hypothetical protein
MLSKKMETFASAGSRARLLQVSVDGLEQLEEDKWLFQNDPDISVGLYG